MAFQVAVAGFVVAAVAVAVVVGVAVGGFVGVAVPGVGVGVGFAGVAVVAGFGVGGVAVPGVGVGFVVGGAGLARGAGALAGAAPAGAGCEVGVVVVLVTGFAAPAVLDALAAEEVGFGCAAEMPAFVGVALDAEFMSESVGPQAPRLALRLAAKSAT